MISSRNPRTLAAEIITEALHDGQPLMATVRKKAKAMSSQDASFLKELVNGILRHKLYLEGILDALVEKPFKAKNIRVKYAIMAGLYQLAFLNTPHHAAVNETVKAVGELGFDTLKGLTNAVMHGYLRKKEELEQKLYKSYETRYSFPQWLITDIKAAYGKSLGITGSHKKGSQKPGATGKRNGRNIIHSNSGLFKSLVNNRHNVHQVSPGCKLRNNSAPLFMHLLAGNDAG